MSKRILFVWAFMYCGLCAEIPSAYADTSNVNLKRQANAFMMIMGYSLTPDVTTGSLSISDNATNNPGLQMTSLGGGGTISESTPIYLEGTIALNRYDPTFILSGGTTSESIPVKWTSISATGGIGYSFSLTKEWRIIPVFNLTLGHVESDLSVLARVAEDRTGINFDFLKGGRLNALGLGGSVILDYEDYHQEREIDIELRYTNIHLNSYQSSEALEGQVNSHSLNLWTRRRIPTNFTLFDKPIRHVMEFAHTQFLGDLRGALGFNSLSSIGTGLELNIKNYPLFFERARVMTRFQFGANVTGWSLGFAASF